MQELLTNVQRHANATTVAIEVVLRDATLVLTVEDDGVGMQLPEQPHTFGILGMRERARAIGGVLALDSTPGAGARARLQLPIESGV